MFETVLTTRSKNVLYVKGKPYRGREKGQKASHCCVDSSLKATRVSAASARTSASPMDSECSCI